MTALVATAALALAACMRADASVSRARHAPTTAAAPGRPANELGVIPVLMYHRILEQPENIWDRTPAQFTAELERLYVEGYRPVPASALVDGRPETPAGTTPVVLTFDDSQPSQMALRPDGQVEPATAVGILLDFSRTHPGFDPAATFYVNAGAFGGADPGPALRYLVDHGFELGDHTATHANLADLDDQAVQREIAAGLDVITTAVPAARVTTMALPFGTQPAHPALAHEGSDGERSYRFSGVFLAGSEPSPSPFSTRFDPFAIPRIRSFGPAGGPDDNGAPSFGSGYWLDVLDQHPEWRFVSDGNPNRVTFPAGLKGQLAPRFAEEARPS